MIETWIEFQSLVLDICNGTFGQNFEKGNPEIYKKLAYRRMNVECLIQTKDRKQVN